MRALELAGQTFGRLFVVKRSGVARHGKPLWLCRCECGNETLVYGDNLRLGRSTGCIHCNNVKHGHATRVSRSITYTTWMAMHARCKPADTPKCKNYGARGISVCRRWQSFENFLADMGERPSSKHSIERKDGSKGYELNNCTWATRREQNANRRDNVYVTIRGVTLCAAEWARRNSISPAKFMWRIREGWDAERALSSVITNRKGSNHPRAKLSDHQAREIKQRMANGERNSDLAMEFNVSRSTISQIASGATWSHL